MTKKKTYRKTSLSPEALERARAELRGERHVNIETAAPSGSGPVQTPATPKPRSTVRMATRMGGSLASRRVPTIEELNEQYTYVIRDLRKLAVVAGMLLVFVVVAALVLPSLAL